MGILSSLVIPPWLNLKTIALAANGLVILGLVIALAVTRHTLSDRTTELANTRAAYSNFQKEVKNKTEAAKIADTKHAAAVHAKDEEIRIKNETSLQAQLSAAHDAAGVYARRLSEITRGSRSGGPQSLGPAPDTPGTVAPAGENPFLDDAEICAENTVKAQGWQGWWKTVVAVPDRE